MLRFLLLLAVVITAIPVRAQSLERPIPSTQPALTSTADLIKLVPEGVIPKPGREWNNVKTLVVQQALDKAVGRTFKIAATVRTIQRDRNEVSVLRLEPLDNASYPATFNARLVGIELLALARMDVGDSVTVEGTVTKVQLVTRTDTGMAVQIELDPATLIGEPVKTDPPATQPGKPAANLNR